MASINIDAILGKVDDWKTSDKGKKRMKSTIDKYVRTNVSKTQAGSPVLTRKAMADYQDYGTARGSWFCNEGRSDILKQLH